MAASPPCHCGREQRAGGAGRLICQGCGLPPELCTRCPNLPERMYDKCWSNSKGWVPL